MSVGDEHSAGVNAPALSQINDLGLAREADGQQDGIRPGGTDRREVPASPQQPTTLTTLAPEHFSSCASASPPITDA